MKSKFLIASIIVITVSVIALYPWLSHSISRAWWSGQAIAAVVDSGAGLVSPGHQIPPHTEQPPEIEVVFVLDTTSSMTGLIDAAKENIWSIASTLASGQPAPRVKMGLVAFRDRGDQYVTKVIDLSEDLDSMYAALMEFRAEGGGDGPESVNKALYDAVTRMAWSQVDGSAAQPAADNTYRVIFLVGDAPPHMDYAGEMQYPEIISLAADKGIVLNTIQAGNDPQTRQTWQRIAQLNQGEYLQVASTGDAIAVATPFDEELASLSKALDNTRLYFGSAETQLEMAGKTAATRKLQDNSSAASLAKRARYNASKAGEANLLGDNELVEAIASGRVELDALAPAELPEPMQTLSKQEQQELIKQKAGRREQLRAEIQALAEQRQQFIENKLQASAGTDDSLDHQVHRALKSQAEKKGISYDATPVY